MLGAPDREARAGPFISALQKVISPSRKPGALTINERVRALGRLPGRVQGLASSDTGTFYEKYKQPYSARATRLTLLRLHRRVAPLHGIDIAISRSDRA